jgi:hypothetical protein
MRTSGTQPVSSVATTQSSLPECNWENINEPGAYVETSTGHLYRFPPEALVQGGSPVIGKSSRQVLKFVRLSDDPNAIISKLRTLAADNDIQPNF